MSVLEDPIQRHPTRAEQLDILLSAIEATAPQGGEVLDVGCGTGYVGHLLSQRRPDLKFVGVDINADALQAADVNLSGFTGSVHLLQGDLNDLENVGIPDGPYHAIFSALTFHDLKDDAKASVIATLARQLADEGFLYIYDRIRLTEAPLFPLQQAIWSRIERVHGVAMRSADSFPAYEEDLDNTNTPARLNSYFEWFTGLGLSAQLLHLHGNIMLLAAAKAPSA